MSGLEADHDIAIDAEVLRHGFIAITEEMKINLMRTAYNMIIYEALDFTVGLFDRDGNTISIGLGLPMFIRGMSETVKATIEEYPLDEMKVGDIYITNDAYTTGSHLNHIVLTLPLFDGSRVIGFTCTMAHWLDIGGVLNGVTRDIFSEGLQVPICKLFDEYEQNDLLVQIIQQNVRDPDLAMGDLRAQIAAVRTGEKRFNHLLQRYGATRIEKAMRFTMERSAERARAAVEKIPDGYYEAESFMDGDGVVDEPIPIHVGITVKANKMIVDMSGISPQVQGFYNSGRTAGLSAAQVAFTCLIDPINRPINDGTYEPLEVVLPDETVVSAVKPAAMRWWMTIPMTVVDTIFKALAPALPQAVPAGHHADLAIVDMNGTHPHGCHFYRCLGGLIGGGWGAKWNGDGMSATICINDGDTHNAPVESMELKYPHLIERHELREDSGGAGEFRGGLGVIQQRRVLATSAINAQIERTQDAPWGLFGGESGAANKLEIMRADGTHETYPTGKVLDEELYEGDAYILYSGGGGGYGDPHKRPTAKVLEDVQQGYVSVAVAREQYGVVIDPTTLSLNEAQTNALRKLD
ncbi:MAG: hydantoinase B/oxoprolinase family protein [Pseudomonadota bacterium]